MKYRFNFEQFTLFLKYFSKEIGIQSLRDQCLYVYFEIILIPLSIFHRFIDALAIYNQKQKINVI